MLRAYACGLHRSLDKLVRLSAFEDTQIMISMAPNLQFGYEKQFNNNIIYKQEELMCYSLQRGVPAVLKVSNLTYFCFSLNSVWLRA